MTILSVLVCFCMRGLFLPDKPNGVLYYFAGPIAIADGFALGMTLSLLGFRWVGYPRDSIADLKHWLDYAAGTFSLYALIGGAFLLVFQFQNMTLFDICLYPFIFLSNYSLVRKMLQSPGWNDD